MGMAKRQMEDADHKRSVAQEIAVEAGCLEECEAHGVFSDMWGDREEAYRLASAHIGETFEDEVDARSEIDAAIEESAESCPQCEKNMAE